MANHMTSIGFEMNSRDDFEEIAQKVYNTGRISETKRGKYSTLNGNDGIELWLQMNKKNEVIGMNPHFSGKSKMKIGITKEIIREADTKLDGAFYAWAAPVNEDMESGSYPFVFDVPNRAIYDELLFPQLLILQLTGFCNEINVYDNEDEFHSSQKGEVKFATESFIPSGLFGDASAPSANVVFTGRVIETKKIINELSGRSFIWSLVKTLGGEIDVVTDEELISNGIKVGGIISGSFWLSGKFISSPELKRRTLFQKFISFRRPDL